MSDTTVNISGLSPDTTKDSLEHFFSFCGKIQSVNKTEKTGTIVFEKASAARTSLMLDGGSLDGATIHVSAPESVRSAADAGARPTSAEGDEVGQEDKPRSAIVAEMLGHGYVLSDTAVTKAIELDQKHGISTKFLAWFKKLDDKYQVQSRAATASSSATAQANQLDAKTGASTKLGSLFQTGKTYYEKALASPHGSKVREFYTNAKKEALDVHAEARRIAEAKAGRPIWQQGVAKESDTAAAAATPTAGAAPTGTSAAAATPAPETTAMEKTEAAGYDVKA